MQDKLKEKLAELNSFLEIMDHDHDEEEEVEELVKWFVDEVHSDDGLTWDELKEKMSEVAKEHGYEPK